MSDLQTPRAECRALWQALCARTEDPSDPVFADKKLYIAERAKLEKECLEIYGKHLATE